MVLMNMNAKESLSNRCSKEFCRQLLLIVIMGCALLTKYLWPDVKEMRSLVYDVFADNKDERNAK